MKNTALPRSYHAAKHLAPEPRALLTVDLRNMSMRKTVIMNRSTDMSLTVLKLKIMMMTTHIHTHTVKNKTVVCHNNWNMIMIMIMTITIMTKRVVNIHKKIMISVTKATIIMTTITTSTPILISMV